jgi:hypothetical protein
VTFLQKEKIGTKTSQLISLKVKRQSQKKTKYLLTVPLAAKKCNYKVKSKEYKRSEWGSQHVVFIRIKLKTRDGQQGH